MVELSARWDMRNLGCFGHRPIRGSATIPSSHGWGSAIDAGFDGGEYASVVRETICPFLVAWSAELHLSALHDYRGSRIWHAGRTPAEDDACGAWWKAQRTNSTTGFGQLWGNHLHLEVDPAGWDDDTPLLERGVS
jgi:hypothetical protein